LRNIVKKARTAKLAAPAVFIVGDVVKLRGKVLERPGKR
jgi:siroheme synthase